jgi:hypothetical protein
MVQTGAVHVVQVGLVEIGSCWLMSWWELLVGDG